MHSGKNVEQRFDKNIAEALKASQHSAPERVRKLRAASHAALAQLIVEQTMQFDVVFIDGCHEPSAVLSDACQSWTLLKPGGILILDDYEWHLVTQRPARTCPKLAIDAFVEVFGPQLIVLDLGYQCIIQKVPSLLKMEGCAA
jgi:predicted O-methyltransferase YrrM